MVAVRLLVETADTSTRKLRIVLTGGTGFIGIHVQKFLLSAGHQVKVFMRHKQPRQLGLVLGCEPIFGNLDDEISVHEAVADCDLVVYCAGTVKGANFNNFVTANISGVKIFASALSLVGSTNARFLLISSLAASRPYLSDYAQSKYLGEQVLKGVTGLRWSILRPPAVYGLGDTEMLKIFRLIRMGIAPLIGPSNQMLSFLHVEDLARSIVCTIAANERMDQCCVDLHDGQPGGYSWSDIIRAVRGNSIALKIPVPRLVADVVTAMNRKMAGWLHYSPMLTEGKVRELSQQEWICDNSLIIEKTGWNPRIGLIEGIRQLV
jgi:nucleoside-diphosphate-sugar epimerase